MFNIIKDLQMKYKTDTYNKIEKIEELDYDLDNIRDNIRDANYDIRSLFEYLEKIKPLTEKTDVLLNNISKIAECLDAMSD
jgi:hypothetical protein